jgi:hypothetical protein
VGARQLDLFVDGRDALLVHAVVAALLDGDPPRAGAALHHLRAEHPEHVDLPALRVLIEAVTESPGPIAAPVVSRPGEGCPDAAAAPRGSSSPAVLADRIDTLERVVAPAARRLLGEHAARVLDPLWQRLAAAAWRLPFDPARPRLHRAWLCQQSGDWAGVRDAVLAEPRWSTAPLLRLWLGLARHHLGEAAPALELWVPLAWMAPDLFARVAPALPSDDLRAAWAAFERAEFLEDPGGDEPRTAWFPAWLLLRHRGLVRVFRPDALPAGGRAARVFAHLLCLIPLERRGATGEVIQQRRALRDLDAEFFRYYMAVLDQGRRPS